MKKRGHVYWVNFTPSVGTETKNRRPGVVVSTNRHNRKNLQYQVVPLTSNLKKLYPGEVIINFRGGKSKALVNQIMSASARRFGNRIGIVDEDEMNKLETILFDLLGMEAIADLKEEE